MRLPRPLELSIATAMSPTEASTLPKHLKRLEAESIEIMREVVAEFKNPVMLYSIGKDSSVMLRLAIKAFHPARLPFPLLHVDTTWKFREMIAFRDEIARQIGFELIVYINREGVARGVNPIASGPSVHTHVMKTEALKAALDLYGFDAAFGGAPGETQRRAERRREYSRFAPKVTPGTRAISAQNCGTYLTRGSGPVSPFASFRYRTGPN